jgi:hypothetical protein
MPLLDSETPGRMRGLSRAAADAGQFRPFGCGVSREPAEDEGIRQATEVAAGRGRRRSPAAYSPGIANPLSESTCAWPSMSGPPIV